MGILSFKRLQKKTARRGATALEMALLMPPFFMLLLGSVEVGLMETTQQLIENAAFNASRVVSTGYTIPGTTPAQTVQQAVNSELQSFGTIIDTTKIKTTSVAYSDFASIANPAGGTPGLGKAQQIVVYTISYPWPFFTPMIGSLLGTMDTNTKKYILNLTSQIVVRNEPY